MLCVSVRVTVCVHAFVHVSAYIDPYMYSAGSKAAFVDLHAEADPGYCQGGRRGQDSR